MTLVDNRSTRVIVVGVVMAVLLFLLVRGLLLAGVAPPVAGFASYVICFALAFLGQMMWSFGKRPSLRGFLRYAAVQIVGATVAAATSWLATLLALDATAAAVATTLLSSAVSFLGTRYWAFTK